MEELLFCLVLIIASPVFFRYFFGKGDNSNHESSITLNRAVLLRWLNNEKSKGKSTIDELIDSLQNSGDNVVNQQISTQSTFKDHATDIQDKGKQNLEVENTTFKETSHQKTVQTPPKQTKNLEDYFSANVLLYLGAALVIFSIFVFVAFSWETFSDFVKGSLLTIFTLSFYFLGFITLNTKSFRQAGITFLTIASVSLGFLGIGLWRFGLEEGLAIDFSTYWTGYALFLIICYVATFRLIGIKRFFYLLLATIYSLIASLAYVITEDEKFRILIMAVLNLVFYASEGIFGKLSNVVRGCARVVNQILNIIIFLTVFTSIDDFIEVEIRIVALIALIIPTIFDLLAYYKERDKLEAATTIIGIPLKLLLASKIFDLHDNATLIIFSVYILLTTLIGEKKLFDTRKNLYVLNTFVNWTIVIISTLYVIFNSYKPGLEASDKAVIALVFITNFLILILPSLLPKIENLIPLTLNYLLLLVYRLLDIYHGDTDTMHYVYAFLILFFSAIAAHIWIYKKNIIRYKFSFVPFISLSGILILALSLTGTSSDVAVTYLMVSIGIFILSYFLKNDRLKILSVPINFVAFFNFLSVVFVKLEIISPSDEMYGLLFLIPFVIYALEFHLEYRKNKLSISNLFGLLVFSNYALFSTAGDAEYSIVVALYLFIYSVLGLIAYRNIAITYIIFLLGNVIIWNTVRIQDTQFSTALLATSVLAILFNLIGQTYTKVKDINLQNSLKHFSYLSIGVTFLLFLITFVRIYIDESLLTSVTAILLGLNLLLSMKIKPGFERLAGVGFVLAIWNLAALYDLNFHFYIVPVTAYLLVLSNIYKKVGNKLFGMVFEYFAYILQFSVLLLQSIFEGDTSKVFYGLALITAATAVLLVGSNRKEKGLIYLALSFIFLELLIRLYVVIVLIDWWMWLCLFGLFLISTAIYILWKLGKNKQG